MKDYIVNYAPTMVLSAGLLAAEASFPVFMITLVVFAVADFIKETQ